VKQGKILKCLDMLCYRRACVGFCQKSSGCVWVFVRNHPTSV